MDDETRKSLEWLIGIYQDEINRLEEDRQRDRGIGFGNALLTGKIGAYGRVIADLKELLEGEEEC